MTTTQLIALLNAMTVGELAVISGKLDEARSACFELGHEELASKLEEAKTALSQADLKTYRKRVETVVARLGHLR